MSYVHDGGRGFKDHTIDGLCAAYGRFLRRIPHTSAVASVSAPRPGRVSTIIGGGSGHYPSFAGLVGPGFADAAVCGDIFTSPSAEQVYRTIRAVDGDAGVLMLFGNYAGDVMHFGLAADQVKARHGIDARITLVTDDIASAPADRRSERRGIAGDFFVFRAAAAAAHRGDSLDEVERLARHTNERTGTIGVGFDGCTVPGRSEPLFTVDDGMMELGLGIHGEPGISTVTRVSAAELAAALTDRLLAERPAGAEQARILVNGLGRVKYEELFVLYRTVAARLETAGVHLTEPEVGEFVTSLDMAGCSVTLVWTDDELEELLSTPVATPGYTRAGDVAGLGGEVRDLSHIVETADGPAEIPEATLDAGGRAARRGVTAIAERMAELEEYLGDLDAVAADGDHGSGMARGSDAARSAARCAGPGASEVLVAAGMAFADAAGGASGALWGAALTHLGHRLADETGTVGAPAGGGPAPAVVAAGLADGRQAVSRLGGSVPGDKTMVDAFDAFVRRYAAEADGGAGHRAAWTLASQAATEAAEATATMQARRGRAARLGKKSDGTPDPGAVSFAAAVTVAGSAMFPVDDQPATAGEETA